MGLEESNIWLICGDAFEQIKLIPSESIDLILTDPPYDNTVYMQGLSYEQKTFLAKEFKRVLKQSGNLALFCGYEDKWKWYNILTRNKLKFVREIIWVYNNPSGFRPMARKGIRKFIAAHETILWFVKSKEYYFNNSGLVEKDWVEHPAFAGFMRLSGKEGLPTKKLNVTPKPLAIAKILVNRLSKENDFVLDPFAGYGTFAIAALMLKRNFVGLEIRPEIHKIAVKRIKKFQTMKLSDFLKGKAIRREAK
jgi:DNA modification methylase